LAFDAPGTVEPAGPDGFDVATGDPWPETVAAELADHVDALVGTRFETLAEDCWDRLVGRLPTLDTGEPAALLHGDVGDGNVLVDGEGVTGFLDWERAAVGHPEYDLCRAEVRCFWSGWGRRDALSSMLYAGYRSRRSIPDGFDGRRRAYLVTSYLLSLASFEDWGPRYADDLDELAGAVAEKVRELLPDGS
jgi:aminoglycoside phosphotransferase (APT) family kinase protein